MSVAASELCAGDGLGLAPTARLRLSGVGRQLLPSHLCEDLEVAKTCQCGSACLSSFIQITVTMNLHHVAHTVVLVDNMGGTEAPIICYFCSLGCYSQFLDRYLQSSADH